MKLCIFISLVLHDFLRLCTFLPGDGDIIRHMIMNTGIEPDYIFLTVESMFVNKFIVL